MLLSLCGGWGLQSHFRVQPNHCLEVLLRCVVVGVVTISGVFSGITMVRQNLKHVILQLKKKLLSF